MDFVETLTYDKIQFQLWSLFNENNINWLDRKKWTYIDYVKFLNNLSVKQDIEAFKANQIIREAKKNRNNKK